MWTYLILNLVFLASVIFFLPKTLSKPKKAFWLTLAVVVALTALFDPIIVALDIVGYDSAKTLGLRFFGAPIEDFFYALYAVIIVPLIWNFLEDKKHDRQR